MSPPLMGSPPFGSRERRATRRYDFSLPTLSTCSSAEGSLILLRSRLRIGNPPVFLLRNNPPTDSRLPLIPNP
jgi:hypothetical protein